MHHHLEEVVKAEGRGGRTRLTKIMEMSKQEWVAQLEVEGEGEVEDHQFWGVTRLPYVAIRCHKSPKFPYVTKSCHMLSYLAKALGQ